VEKTFQSEGLDLPVIKEAKSFIGKVGFECGDFLGTFSNSFTKGFFYKYRDPIKTLARSMDEHLDKRDGRIEAFKGEGVNTSETTDIVTRDAPF
jgi:hypothetical protein